MFNQEIDFFLSLSFFIVACRSICFGTTWQICFFCLAILFFSDTTFYFRAFVKTYRSTFIGRSNQYKQCWNMYAGVRVSVVKDQIFVRHWPEIRVAEYRACHQHLMILCSNQKRRRRQRPKMHIKKIVLNFTMRINEAKSFFWLKTNCRRWENSEPHANFTKSHVIACCETY